MIELDSIGKTGNRTKASYRLTEKGRNEFLKLLKEGLSKNSVVYPTTLYTALSFLDELPKQAASEALALQKLDLTNELESMKAGRNDKSKHYQIPEHITAIFDNIYAQIELQIEFITKLQKLIEDRP